MRKLKYLILFEDYEWDIALYPKPKNYKFKENEPLKMSILVNQETANKLLDLISGKVESITIGDKVKYLIEVENNDWVKFTHGTVKKIVEYISMEELQEKLEPFMVHYNKNIN